MLFWQAHEGGLLAIEEWDEGILTQARDNKIHYFPLPTRPSSSISRSSASATPSPNDPSPLPPSWSMDVNAMAYCKMSILPLDGALRKEGLVAVPSLTKDEEIDVFHLPSQERVHRAIGKSLFPIGAKTGTLMALKIFLSPSESGELCIVSGYEDGRVALFRFTGSAKAAITPPRPGTHQDEAEGWELVWDEKGHREALMSVALSPDKRSVWSVAADHFLCRYDLFRVDDPESETVESRMVVLPTPAPGRSIVALRDDGKIFGVSGWDGEARLYSVKTGEPLAVLSYHRMSLHALAFSPLKSLVNGPGQPSVRLDDDDSSSDEEEGTVRPRAWLATGGKDDRISLWEVYPSTRN
ncbi:ASTRA-associated protein 1, partial [Phenoliferia sp. Uapishka_3]